MALSQKQANAVIEYAGQYCVVSEVQKKLREGDLAGAWHLAEWASSLIFRAQKISIALEVELRGLLAQRKFDEAEKIVSTAERS